MGTAGSPNLNMSDDFTIHEFWETIFESDEFHEAGVWPRGGQIMADMGKVHGARDCFVFVSFSYVVPVTRPSGNYLAFVCEEKDEEKEVARFDGKYTLIKSGGASQYAKQGHVFIRNPEWPTLTKSANKR